MAERPPPSEQELEALKVLWDEGPGTVRSVAEALEARGRRWGYTTVQTYLNRLRAKGHVASEAASGRWPASTGPSRPATTCSATGSRSWPTSSARAPPRRWSSTLVERHRFSDEEIARFRALLDHAKKGRGYSARRVGLALPIPKCVGRASPTLHVSSSPVPSPSVHEGGRPCSGGSRRRR